MRISRADLWLTLVSAGFIQLSVLSVSRGSNYEKAADTKTARAPVGAFLGANEGCLTQTRLKAGFKNLKDIILKKGETSVSTDYNDYTELTHLTYENTALVYRISGRGKHPLEMVTVSGGGAYYWIVHSGNKYSLETKDFPEAIGRAKLKEAQDHFCNRVMASEMLKSLPADGSAEE